MENYRKIYEEYYNIKIPKDFDIHHIDLDHNNNDISNLVMLPKKLHNEYHRLYSSLPNNIEINKEISLNGRGYNYYMIKTYKEFNDVLEECNKWYDKQLGIIKEV